MKEPRIRLLVADDHTIVRRGLVSLLSLHERFEVVGEAADGRAAVELASKLKPDVVLMDINMPLLNGLEATIRIRKQRAETKVLVLSAHDNEEYVVQVLRSGADGYLLKNGSAEDLTGAILAVHAGQQFFSPAIPRALLEGSGGGPHGVDRSQERTSRLLTPREREILQLVAEGHTHQKIADLLFISVRTVDTHCNNLMKKLDIHDGAGLVTYALKNGIISLPR